VSPVAESDAAVRRRRARARVRTGRRALLAAALLAAGCSAHRTAGTGDVAFRLTWSGISDLDLLVEDPAGECIFFGHRESPTGGLLDVDCNAGARPCPHPIENVYWPRTAAPAGRYRVWVEAHSLLPAETPVRFELQVLRGRTTTFRHVGFARENDEVHGAFVYTFPAGELTASAGASELPATCTARHYYFRSPDAGAAPPAGRR
jgi:hypothetical protein